MKPSNSLWCFDALVRFLDANEHADSFWLKRFTAQTPGRVNRRRDGAGKYRAESRKRYEQYKGNFKATACSVCGVKTPPSWDVDLVSMVQRVGEPYTKVFLLAYSNPNFKIHATLASASQPDEDREEKDAETALIVATERFLAVIRSQNALFSLKLDADVEACTQDLRHAQARALSPT